MTDRDADDFERVTPVIEITAGLVLAVIAMFALIWLIPNHVGQDANALDVGPGFFPKLSAWMVLGLSLSHVAVNIRGFRPDVAGRRGSSILFEIAAWLGVVIATYIGLSLIGFLIVAPLLIIAGAYACGYQRWWVILIIAALFPIMIDQAAWLVFTVDLP